MINQTMSSENILQQSCLNLKVDTNLKYGGLQLQACSVYKKVFPLNFKTYSNILFNYIFYSNWIFYLERNGLNINWIQNKYVVTTDPVNMILVFKFHILKVSFVNHCILNNKITTNHF